MLPEKASITRQVTFYSCSLQSTKIPPLLNHSIMRYFLDPREVVFIIETFYQIPNAPKLALLADLHGRPFDRVTDSLRAYKPELICIAGDIIYGLWPENDRSPLETQVNVLPFLRACTGLAPTFLSLGNHEQYLDVEDLNLIRATGVTILDNRWVKRDGLVIGGLTSGAMLAYQSYLRAAQVPQNSRYPRIDYQATQKASQPETTWLSRFASTPAFHILLSHHPEYFPLIPGSVELVLSGHAHGGQWRFFNPIRRQWAGVYAPGQGLWPRWTKGIYDGRLIVTAGLSNTTSIPRLFNPTEVVYIEGM